MFTQEQINEIEHRLAKKGAKDTQLPSAKTPLTGDESIVIVQERENRLVPIGSILNTDEGVFNVSEYLKVKTEADTSVILTLSEAIEACPSRAKKAGQIITFLDKTKVWKQYQYQSNNITDWNNLLKWKNLNDINTKPIDDETAVIYNISDYIPGGSKYGQVIYPGIYTIYGTTTPVSQYRVIGGYDDSLGEVSFPLQLDETIVIKEIDDSVAIYDTYYLFAGNSIDGYGYQTTLYSDDDVIPDYILKAFGDDSAYVLVNINRLENRINDKLDKKVDKVQGKGLSTNDFTDANVSELANSVVNATYNSNTKKLIFTKNNNETVEIDATPFIKDGMVNSVSIVDGYLVITFNTDAGKETIRIPVTDIFDLSNYYDKDDVDGLLAGKANKSEMSVVPGTGANADKATITLKQGTSATVLTTHQDITGKQDTINDLAAIRSGAQAGATAVQPSEITPINNRLDNVEYCLGDYLKEIYVFNWENHTTTTTEPIYTTTTLWTTDGNHNFRTFSCRLTAGSATISALYLGKMENTDMMYFTQSGTVTMYLALYDRPSTIDNLIRVYDASGNTVKIISTYEVPYSSQHVCTPFTFEVEPGYYLKMVAKVAGVPELIWLGQIDFEIAGVKQIDKDVHANSAAIETIEQKIPEQASSSNKLADKNFVNSSIATATATYRGAYNLVTDLSLTISATHAEIATALATAIQTADNNDYCYVQIPVADETPAEIASVERYKFGTAWEYEYTLNNSGFTAAQWAALNSGITSGLVAKLSALPTNSELTALLSGKANTADLAEVATSGSYNDLSDKPTIPDITGKADKVSNATNGNFAALDSNGNLIDSGHKHSDYITQHQNLTNYVQKSQTAGLLKNDGTVDTNTYLTQHQDISGKENIIPIEAVASGTTVINAAVNTYYEVAGEVGVLAITLPTPTDLTKVSMVVVHLTAGTNPNVVIGAVDNPQPDFAAAYDISAGNEYEINCLFNGDKWIVADMEVV